MISARWLNTKVSVDLRNTHLPHVLAAISRQTGLCLSMRGGLITLSQRGTPPDPSALTALGDYCLAAYREACGTRADGGGKPSPIQRIVLRGWADSRGAAWRLAGISDDTVLVCGDDEFAVMNASSEPHDRALYIPSAGPVVPIVPASPISAPREFTVFFKTGGALGGPALVKGRLMTYAKGPWSGDIAINHRGKPQAVGPAKVTLRRYSARADYVSVAVEVPPLDGAKCQRRSVLQRRGRRGRWERAADLDYDRRATAPAFNHAA